MSSVKLIGRVSRGALATLVAAPLLVGLDAGVVQASTTTTFSFTGGVQSFVVPAGVTTVQVVASGAGSYTYFAQNGSGIDDPSLGMMANHGAKVTTVLTVTPGETLTVLVGGTGSTSASTSPGGGGFNGGGGGRRCTTFGYHTYSGGGGGASDVRRGGAALVNRVVVAGGAGGGQTVGASGGSGGMPNGANGFGNPLPEVGGKGGTQLAAGGPSNAGGGAAGSGATGGVGATCSENGPGGGGGGGYFGGGGGGSTSTILSPSFVPGSFGGGGGGSSFSAGVSTTYAQEASLTGSIAITPLPPTTAPTAPQGVAAVVASPTSAAVR